MPRMQLKRSCKMYRYGDSWQYCGYFSAVYVFFAIFVVRPMIKQLFNASYIAMSLGFIRKILRRLLPCGTGGKYLVAMGAYNTATKTPLFLVYSVEESYEAARKFAFEVHRENDGTPRFNVSIIRYPERLMSDLISTESKYSSYYKIRYEENLKYLPPAQFMSVFSGKAVKETHIVPEILKFETERSVRHGESPEKHKSFDFLIM